MAAPLTTISYRIQNIDYLTYLELTDWSTNLQLRTYRKDDASKQQVGTLLVAALRIDSSYLVRFSGISLTVEAGLSISRMSKTPQST